MEQDIVVASGKVWRRGSIDSAWDAHVEARGSALSVAQVMELEERVVDRFATLARAAGVDALWLPETGEVFAPASDPEADFGALRQQAIDEVFNALVQGDLFAA